MTTYTMPTEAQDHAFEQIADHARSIFNVLRTLAAGERMVVEVWHMDDGSLASSCTSAGLRISATSVEVGTYTSAVDRDALREDIEFAVRQL